MNETISVPSFERFPVSCGSTTRHFPLKVVRTQDFAEAPNVFALGKRLLGSRPKGWIQAGQPHGDVVSLYTPDRESFSIDFNDHADGLVTLNRDEILSILTADCLPIFFYLEDPLAVGLVHAGWRGSAKKIAQQAVLAFRQLSPDYSRRLHVAFGPAIRSCCYEVSEDFRKDFPKSLIERQKRFYLDLADENRRQLLEAGLLPERIGPAGPCSGCRIDQFYSHRKEKGKTYRMLSWIALSAVL